MQTVPASTVTCEQEGLQWGKASNRVAFKARLAKGSPATFLKSNMPVRGACREVPLRLPLAGERRRPPLATPRGEDEDSYLPMSEQVLVSAATAAREYLGGAHEGRVRRATSTTTAAVRISAAARQ